MQTSLAFCVESSNGVILSNCIYSCGQIVATRTQHRRLNSFALVSFSRPNVPLSCSNVAVPHEGGDCEAVKFSLSNLVPNVARIHSGCGSRFPVHPAGVCAGYRIKRHTGAGPVQVYGAPRVHLEIIIWHQSIRFTGWGHVSYNIDGVSWSWQLQGWEPRILIADYIKANDFETKRVMCLMTRMIQTSRKDGRAYKEL